MADLVLTLNEIAVLGVVALKPTFTVAQLAMWAHMTPSGIHETVRGLIQKKLMTPIEGDALKLTDAGMSAVKQVMRKSDKQYWVLGKEESFASSGVDEALDNWIDRLV